MTLGASAQYFPAGGLANPNLPIRRIISSVYLKDTLMVSLTRGKLLANSWQVWPQIEPDHPGARQHLRGRGRAKTLNPDFHFLSDLAI
jgi:hypothetical protein